MTGRGIEPQIGEGAGNAHKRNRRTHGTKKETTEIVPTTEVGRRSADVTTAGAELQGDRTTTDRNG